MKSNRTFLFHVALAVIAAVAVTACAKPPTEEMNNAYEAVTRAENDIDAVTYGGNSLARAREALANMQKEADSKRYDSAKSYATEAIAAAERAINEGRTGESRARDEASSLLSELRPLILETEQGIRAARSAGLPLDFKSINSEFEDARGNVDSAQTSLSAGRFKESLEQGRTARSELNSINQQLSSSAMSVSRKK
jgi:hypothetical protein